MHFFSCSTPRGKFALVDLPGYGYARAPRAERERWGEAVERYLLGRDNLRGLVLLCDVRRDLAEEERLLEDLAERRELALIRVATKIDKLGRADRVRRLRALDEAADEAWIPFSAKTLEGRDQLLEALVAVAAG